MKSVVSHSVVRVALFEESAHGTQGWIAKSMEGNLIAQGKTVEEAKAGFLRVLKTHLILCRERGEVPLLGMKIRKADSPKAPVEPCSFSDRVRFSKMVPA